MTEPAIAIRGVYKQFGPVQANIDIHFKAYGGRIHALLGENGAGKSTLMSILAGRHQPDSGELLINGQICVFTSPAAALKHGIGMVYQRFMLIESMSVAENLTLAVPRKVRPSDASPVIRATAERYGLSIDPDKYIFELSMGERQRVEIIKLLLLDAQVLIFDEPTAILTPQEIEAFFAILTKLRSTGKAIIFITHKLEEVLQVADDISIMRKGRLVVSTKYEQQITKRQLARLMVGRDVVLRIDKDPFDPQECILRVENLTGPRNGVVSSYSEISFSLRRGEIFSLIGVAGNGQAPLVASIAGLLPAQTGSITFLGKTYSPTDWYSSDKQAIAYIPEDRYHTGSVGALSLSDNYGLTQLQSFSTGLAGLRLDQAQMVHQTEQAIASFQIKTESATSLAATLSGGNLQKLILARELSRSPRLLIAEQPTQGLDISATEAVWQALLDYRANAAVLLVTTDLKEALSLSDRIGVIFNGQILEIIEATDSDGISRIGLLMAGVRQ